MHGRGGENLPAPAPARSRCAATAMTAQKAGISNTHCNDTERSVEGEASAALDWFEHVNNAPSEMELQARSSPPGLFQCVARFRLLLHGQLHLFGVWREQLLKRLVDHEMAPADLHVLERPLPNPLFDDGPAHAQETPCFIHRHAERGPPLQLRRLPLMDGCRFFQHRALSSGYS